jgi:hypothetical protein
MPFRNSRWQTPTERRKHRRQISSRGAISASTLSGGSTQANNEVPPDRRESQNIHVSASAKSPAVRPSRA